VAYIVVPLKLPDNEPQPVGKKFDNVEANVVPFPYDS
jgi:hypothetical protein